VTCSYRSISVLLLVMVATLDAQSSDTRGVLSEGVYDNAALGMRIKLPARWQFLEKESQQQLGLKPSQPSSDAPNCRGPFCNQDIDVALISVPGTEPVGTIFLAAWKLPPEYLNQQKYPLVEFARHMTLGSMGQSGLTPLTGLEPIHLGKTPAYRLVSMTQSGGKVFGYVAIHGDHVFLLTATPFAGTQDKTRTLQESVESMQLR